MINWKYFLRLITMMENYKLKCVSILWKNREKCIEKGKQYYEDSSERLQKMARDQYKALSDEQEDKKKEYAKNRYQNMFE